MITAGILLAAVAATHFASVEGDEWKSSPLQSENVSERSGGSEAANFTLELFATDGKTPRAGSVPWRAWGTTFNELDLGQWGQSPCGHSFLTRRGRRVYGVWAAGTVPMWSAVSISRRRISVR